MEWYGDPDLPAYKQCLELHGASRRGSISKVRCVATGVLWSTRRPGALEVSLGSSLLESVRAMAAAKAHFIAEPLPADDGFLALSRHVATEPPGDHGLFARVGGSPEVPLATVRGTWGFEKVQLCAFDVRGTLSPGLSPPAKPHSEPLVQLARRQFLAGQLCGRPEVVPIGVGAAPYLEADDARHVLWLLGIGKQPREAVCAELESLRKRRRLVGPQGSTS